MKQILVRLRERGLPLKKGMVVSLSRKENRRLRFPKRYRIGWFHG
jgi:hypothetical protein